MRPADKKRFLKFIEDSGAEMLEPTSEWEVVRFRANGQTGIVYRNKSDALTFVGQAQDAFEAFANKKPWSAQEKVKRKKKSTTVKSLLKRDGLSCFYCGIDMADGFETVEHVLSIKHGGSNHVANMVLAHGECNLHAASMTIIDKIKLRDELRAEVDSGIF